MLLSPGTSSSQFNGKAFLIFQSILKRVFIQRAGYRDKISPH